MGKNLSRKLSRIFFFNTRPSILLYNSRLLKLLFRFVIRKLLDDTNIIIKAVRVCGCKVERRSHSRSHRKNVSLTRIFSRICAMRTVIFHLPTQSSNSLFFLFNNYSTYAVFLPVIVPIRSLQRGKAIWKITRASDSIDFVSRHNTPQSLQDVNRIFQNLKSGFSNLFSLTRSRTLWRSQFTRIELQSIFRIALIFIRSLCIRIHSAASTWNT